jgi:hypothetical protein
MNTIHCERRFYISLKLNLESRILASFKTGEMILLYLSKDTSPSTKDVGPGTKDTGSEHFKVTGFSG